MLLGQKSSQHPKNAGCPFDLAEKVSVTPTTVNLLLQLGSQLVTLLSASLNKRPTKQEAQEIRALLNRYQSLAATHTEAEHLILRYNTAFIAAVAQRTVAALYPLCTFAGYQHVQTAYKWHEEYGVIHLTLNQIEVLSVNLTKHKIESSKLVGDIMLNDEHAEAYVREKWTIIYQQGQQVKTDSVNSYQLQKDTGVWKVEGKTYFNKVE